MKRWLTVGREMLKVDEEIQEKESKGIER